MLTRKPRYSKLEPVNSFKDWLHSVNLRVTADYLTVRSLETKHCFMVKSILKELSQGGGDFLKKEISSTLAPQRQPLPS